VADFVEGVELQQQPGMTQAFPVGAPLQVVDDELVEGLQEQEVQPLAFEGQPVLEAETAP
jgi:hypothetical protein